ncbi:MAG: rhodanese-like domain-containing protein [Cytophaga sp.]|uniref:rhodanese-like domain-containing protein n=1 Tax=Cytophaga sp. TaxID=29535 RepID=UPI003F7E2DC6
MTIIDVRSPQEYTAGHGAGSINIPLQELKDHLTEIKAFAQPLVLCCASGYRSGQATDFLNGLGISCTNGGSWQQIYS